MSKWLAYAGCADMSGTRFSGTKELISFANDECDADGLGDVGRRQ